ncbi:MAG: (2Fe-2S)-binding protein [Salipiger thiooxidans]|uniref:hypothetical protein n=1 Tax=Salipiger thiooxidans TaxID=282683 RepID=UPI001CFBA36C|nr:hypothetical protein [Salipiger thiooxidans]
MTSADSVPGLEVRTIETKVGRKVVEAWVANEVAQCGDCQSGQVLAATTQLPEIQSSGDDRIGVMAPGQG